MKKLFLLIILLISLFPCGCQGRSIQRSGLDTKWADPPREAGVRCWWWWLNGNVTKEAITRDLEAMHDKGFSGAMIFDAGGANHGGNKQVPAGPTFASPKWTELFLHALHEAKRLDLKIGLSIQSGWNLGGPNVTPDFSAKQLTWSEVQIQGPAEIQQILPTPKNRRNYYRDVCVLAFPSDVEPGIKASSQQDSHPAHLAFDGNADTFWVSSGVEPGQGPTPKKTEWIDLSFEKPVEISGLRIQGRRDYGPRKISIICNDSGAKTKSYSLQKGINEISFDSLTGKVFRIVFEDAYDPQSNTSPRNVQVAELALLNSVGKPMERGQMSKPIQNLSLKAAYRELGMSAPDTRFLLNSTQAGSDESSISLSQIQNITEKMDAQGRLTWQVPEGNWTILRIGYTITNAHVSTYSGNWKGLVIDYLSKEAFDRYWFEIVDPLLKKAGPMVGTVLTQLETDSWECSGMNWSPNFAADFKNYCGYDPIPYLPVIAGKVIKSRDASNAFLADFRKTIGHFVSENHYKVFAERAAEYNLGIQPESAGPHAGPLDGITNYQYNDIVMSEFWVPSPHRPKPYQRFFVKQASSAAHIYGKKYVGAESFTSIGPHWNDVLWKSLKPSMDHEYCSGLNMVFFHTFTCSPKEMGIPGQEYFAGTHVNPQVTWWDYSDPFMDYMGRIQYLLQQGKFVADVLYYYGDHVPNIASLKESDPAGAMPGYDYDVTNEDILLRLKVRDGKILAPGGIEYRILVLPNHKVLSMAALEKVSLLLEQGATVLGPKSERLVSLVGGAEAQQRFHVLSDQLWGKNPSKRGQKTVGKGRLVWGQTANRLLRSDGINRDFEAIGVLEDSHCDYIHYTIQDADVYFVCNQTQQPFSADCAFRVTGKQPELWDPITGRIDNAKSFYQSNQKTILPIDFDPYGSYMVVFRKPINSNQKGNAGANHPVRKTIQQIQGPWQVSFDPAWGGPKQVKFDELVDWTQQSEQGIKYYSGKAVYKNQFNLAKYTANKPYWLELNNVEDVGIAAVKLNGKDMGVVWTKPFRVDITDAVKLGENAIEITVVNSWRNRLIGDRDKPQDQRYTQTNITIRNDWKLLPSGLIGPVVIRTAKDEGALETPFKYPPPDTRPGVY